MKKLLTTLMVAALAAVSSGCGGKAVTGSPWTRWGISQPTAETGAEARLADAHRLLYELRFDTAQARYQALVASLPQSAEAHLGLSIACRYAGSRDMAFSEAGAAFALDSAAAAVLLNYGNLLMPMRTGPVTDLSDSARYAESERLLLKAAASHHPFNAHAHIELWAGYMGQGRLSDARHQAFELSQKHYYPKPLLDFAHNLLVGLAPSAILFTNGDNDTYPPWALQNAGKPFRPDVTVANLTLLNLPAVVKMMRDSFGLPVSLSDAEIDSLAPRPGPIGMEPPAQQVVADVVAGSARAGRPVYFAVTVRSEVAEKYRDRLVLEGLVNRFTEGKPAAPVDAERIEENLEKNYRLGWPDTLPPWPQNMSPLTRRYAPLALNYANLYLQVAVRNDTLGRIEDAAAARREAVVWLLRGGKKDDARVLVGELLQRSPDDPAAKKLQARLNR